MAFVYTRGISDSNSGNSWSAMAAQIMLMGTGYVADRDQDFVSDIVANEIATTNYARQSLANKVVTIDDVNNRVLLDADDVTWIALGPGAGGPVVSSGVVFRNTGVAATSPLWFYMDGAATQVNGGNFTYQWAATGLVIETSP